MKVHKAAFFSELNPAVVPAVPSSKASGPGILGFPLNPQNDADLTSHLRQRDNNSNTE